jgi:hypothetical protein
MSLCLRSSLLLGMLGCFPVASLGVETGAGPLNPTALYLRAGTVSTAKPTGTLAGAIGARPAGTRFVVQLDGPITPQRRALMQAAGIQIGDYLPSYAYIVTLDQAHPEAVAALDFIRWHSEYQNQWKLDPELLKRPYSTPERLATLGMGRYPVSVSLFSGVNPGAAERAIWAIPGVIVTGEQMVGDHLELALELPRDQVGTLATIPAVHFIEPLPEVGPRNSTTRWIIQSNQLNVTPVYANGLHGEGQVVGILDAGFDINHCSFRDPVNNTPGPSHRKVLYRTDGIDAHGTHVSGTAVGDNGDNTDTRGMAYLAKMTYSNWPAFTEAGIIDRLTTHYGFGARLHTNSWGDDGTTAYNSLCRGIDVFQYNNEDAQVFFAVTNQSALKNPENAKNLVAVGNCFDTPSQNNFSTGGTGPTSDGRRKPEIWAPGTTTASAQSGTACGIVSAGFTGTSMASPAITGGATLIRQYYTDGYYPGGIANPSAGFVPSGALVKATVMNSGVDMTGGAGYPGIREGWGRMLLDNALYFPGDARKLLVSDVRNNAGLSTNGVTDITFTVTGTAEPLRCTLVWTEPAAAAGAAQAAVNDLDLEIIAPDASLYRGNVFSAAGVSTTGGTKDPRNNVEQVHIVNPAPGQWTFRIRGANVAVGTQGYAAVITGDILPPAPAPLYMSLVSTIPALLAPGTPLDMDVRIVNGTQNYLPGSGRLHYRMSSSGSFTPVPLTPQGGDLHRGTLPGALCGDTPQFYFTASSDGGFNASVPFNAPTSLLSTQIGQINTTVVMPPQDFESGLPAGWAATGLWHVAQGCAPAGTCTGGGTRWAYYGQDSGCTFNTGAVNSGTLTMPAVALPAIPAGGQLNLTFCSSKVGETSTSYDLAQVLVNNTVIDTMSNSASWENKTISLASYAGQTVTIAFRFNTVDNVNNDFRGWSIDNVGISGQVAGCTNPPPSCYANCDGSTAAPILNVGDFTCFLQRFAAGESYANCDDSTAPPVLNVGDFTCFLQRFAAGCP